jgi:spore coat polysaccharide biosynthesis protein SpsF
LIGAIIQARTGSSRLPNKVLMKIDKKNTILSSVISQLTFCKKLDKMIIATTTEKSDDKIIEECKKISALFFRGNELDVLDRFYECAKYFSLSTIIRITCDDPLIDPTIVDKAIEKFFVTSSDYVVNFKPRTFPQGTEVEVFSFSVLEETWKKAKKLSEREHVTPYIYNHPDRFKIYNLEYHSDISYLRWTVDRRSDLEFVKKITSKIKKRPILMNDILKLLKQEPSLIEINKNYILDEGYLKSLKEDNI